MENSKRLLSVSLIISAVLSLMLISGCQDEFVEIMEPPPEEAFTGNSPIANLLERTTLKDGSVDNIIDHSSCITVKLPVTVIVNGIELIISSEADFGNIEKIIDASDTDIDVLEIIFPITVILEDHSEVIVESTDQLEELSEDCLEGGLDDDIECLDFKYPLSFSTFNSDNQLADVVTVNNDSELYNFFKDLEDFEYISLHFPVTVILFNGEEVVINDNNELENLIETVGDDCDEDDDNDFDEDDIDDTAFKNILTDGNWVVTYLFLNEDQTVTLAEFIFKFKPDGVILVSDGSTTSKGEWDSFGDKGILEVEFDIDSDKAIGKIDNEWEVMDFNSDVIQLQKEADGDDPAVFLTFERPEGATQTIYEVSEVIVNGIWKVTSYVLEGVDETSNYLEYTLDFAEAGTVFVTDGTTETTGTWSEELDGDRHIFELDFDSSTIFKEFNEDWQIVEFNETRVYLRDTSGGEDTVHELVFERIQ